MEKALLTVISSFSVIILTETIFSSNGIFSLQGYNFQMFSTFGGHVILDKDCLNPRNRSLPMEGQYFMKRMIIVVTAIAAIAAIAITTISIPERFE